jgi:hypothetical protein
VIKYILSTLLPQFENSCTISLSHVSERHQRGLREGEVGGTWAGRTVLAEVGTICHRHIRARSFQFFPRRRSDAVCETAFGSKLHQHLLNLGDRGCDAVRVTKKETSYADAERERN